MSKELFVNAIRTAERLRLLEAERAMLHLSLEKALHIGLLWPDVFEHGALKAGWEGVAADPWWVKAGRPSHLHHTYKIIAGNGEIRKFPYEEVSTLLGGGLEV